MQRCNIFSFPNALSFFRILATPLFLYFSYTHNTPSAMVIFTVAVLSDWADGYLARLLHQESKVGELLDPIADKIFLMGSFLGFYFLGSIPLFLVIIVLGRDILLLLMGGWILFKKYDFHMKPARLSKWNTLLQMMYIGIIAFFPTFSWVHMLAILVSITTILSGFLYLHVFKTWYSFKDDDLRTLTS
jgi:cardiolipin synthase